VELVLAADSVWDSGWPYLVGARFCGGIYGALVGIGEWALWATETRWARKKCSITVTLPFFHQKLSVSFSFLCVRLSIVFAETIFTNAFW
jgi:hypothetical protein